MVCSPPGFSLQGISQARILEWPAISFSRGSSWPRDWICIFSSDRKVLYHWITREAILFSVLNQFSHSVVSDSLWPHGQQHIRLRHPSPTPRITQTHVHKSVMPSNHLILSCPLLLPPSITPSIKVFSNESVLHIKWPKYWNFSISLSNEYSGLISFRINWLDLLTVQGTLKSLLQHHISKVSILQHSAFFIVQLSWPYMTTGKTTALPRWTFVGKVVSAF